MTQTHLTIAFLIGTLFALGCGGTQKTEAEKKREAQMLAVEVKADAEIEKYDLNGDGKPDVWKFYNLAGTKDIPRAKRKRVLARKHMDVNFNGKVDMKVHYNRFGGVVKEEMDMDFDGNFDAIDYYKDGVLYKRALAFNFKKKPNMWKYFAKGKLIRKERDTNGTGKPDVFEYYEKGKLTQVGYDRDGDGRPDDYDRVGRDSK